ncbi:hypothetical protein [Ammonifex thiophilus]|uniref:Uncharacterized protein n=1 Tax=Ammonifex thiophilus TaxID=444093 RepID=A0A3D8P427_9THEO|nr:hypothetical protein [Ammonifex thiophilus]RDV81788.1 hypothetical protein DXX99_08790 [Ammonifex thiophilus]
MAGKKEARILGELARLGAARPAELAAALGEPPDRVRAWLSKLRAAGLVAREGRLYKVAGSTTATTTETATETKTATTVAAETRTGEARTGAAVAAVRPQLGEQPQPKPQPKPKTQPATGPAPVVSPPGLVRLELLLAQAVGRLSRIEGLLREILAELRGRSTPGETGQEDRGFDALSFFQQFD